METTMTPPAAHAHAHLPIADWWLMQIVMLLIRRPPPEGVRERMSAEKQQKRDAGLKKGPERMRKIKEKNRTRLLELLESPMRLAEIIIASGLCEQTCYTLLYGLRDEGLVVCDKLKGRKLWMRTPCQS